MKKLTNEDLHLLQRVSDAGGSHCFRQEDNIPAAGHKALRGLASRGYLQIEPTDDGIRVTLLPLGQSEVSHG